MKTAIVTMACLLFSIVSQSQNKNVKSETKTTVTTVKSSDGEKKYVKNETVKEVQNIKLNEPTPGTKNIDMKPSPVDVVTTTKVTNPDGTTRTVDVDRSSAYSSNGETYKLTSDASGYTMTNDKGSQALLRRTTTNSYIYRSAGKTAISYFDTNGDLVVEIYDDKSDKVTIEKYTAVKK
jgi:hypothetical protein